MLLSELLDRPVPRLFLTGKGGVGKTSIACALAIALADRGRSVLLVSTDPASNLDEVLGSRLGRTPTPVAGVPRLWALNIDPLEAAAAYRERVVGPYRGVLPDSAVASIEEQLSGACTVEIAAFDEFTSLLAGHAADSYDHVLFDTAPTGHTLRLLSLPSAWTGFIDTNSLGTSCIGPLAGLTNQQALYRAAMDSLADPAQTQVVLVARPDSPTLREAERTLGELQALGIHSFHLVVNGIFKAVDDQDPLAAAMDFAGAQALQAMPFGLRPLTRSEVPLAAASPIGIDALRSLLSERSAHLPETVDGSLEPSTAIPLSELIDEIEAPGRGLILTMGKGGVGKTTVAAAIATELAMRGHEVLLTTTDPAAHVEAAVRSGTKGLEVSRIDPHEETEAYRRMVMETVGAGLDAEGRAVLNEDLRSPCTEEIAVFRAFARTVAEAGDRFVVVDTAPTGHTLLLLDAAQNYHREVERRGTGSDEAVNELLPRLRDPSYTRVLIVTLPEATPVHEAASLQEDLARAGIKPMAWVVNQSLLAARPRDPVLAARAGQERARIEEIRNGLSERVAVLPWRPTSPTPAVLLAVS